MLDGIAERVAPCAQPTAPGGRADISPSAVAGIRWRCNFLNWSGVVSPEVLGWRPAPSVQGAGRLMVSCRSAGDAVLPVKVPILAPARRMSAVRCGGVDAFQGPAALGLGQP